MIAGFGGFFEGDDGAADGVVGETEFAHGLGAVEVSAVEDDGVFQTTAHFFEVGVLEFIPIGADDQGVGAGEGGVGIVDVVDLIAEDHAAGFVGDGVMCEDGCAAEQ